MISRVRGAWVATSLAAAGAIVAIASRQPLHRAGAAPRLVSGVPGQFVGLLMLAAVAFGAAMLLLALVPRHLPRRREPQVVVNRAEPPWWSKLLAAGFLLLLGGGFLTAALVGLRADRRRGQAVMSLNGAGNRTLRAPHGPTPGRGASTFTLPGWLPWLAIGLAAGTLLLGLVVLVLRRRRLRDGDDRGAGREQAAVSAAVNAAADALASAGDPRTGVIRAYLAMQRTLEEHGIERRDSEAPREYLRRALRADWQDRARPDGETLTALFEEARFSEHPISETVRGRAGEALGGLRASLRTGSG